MIKRFQRIKKEFGFFVFLRILVLVIGLLGMVILDFFAFSSLVVLLIALIGLIVGFFVKNQIPKGFEYYPKIVSGGLFVYGIVLFLGDRFGIENSWKLVIISITTVVIFNLQFWSLSDESVVNIENATKTE